MFREINEAMGVLGDEDKRSKYDMGFDLDDMNSGLADMFMGNRMSGGSRRRGGSGGRNRNHAYKHPGGGGGFTFYQF